MTDVLVRRKFGYRDTQGGWPCEDRGTYSVMLPSTKDAWDYQKLEETRKGLPLEASEGEWPCQHPDFGF